MNTYIFRIKYKESSNGPTLTEDFVFTADDDDSALTFMNRDSSWAFYKNHSSVLLTLLLVRSLPYVNSDGILILAEPHEVVAQRRCK
jgi:hypothetical protein